MKKIISCLATAAVAFGMLSAVTFVKADAVTAPSFTTAKVSLNENIVLKFGIDNYTEDYTLTFGYKGETYEGKVENGEAAFSLVTPQYLGETVTATLTKGEETITKTYSVKDYLYSLVHAKNTDESFKNYSCEKFVKMKTLAVDMLNYGAEAQKKYLSVTDNLVTKDLTDAEKAYATDFAAPDESVQATLSGTKAGYEWVSAGIRFDYNVSLYFVIKPLTENAVLKLKINDNEVIDKFIVENGNYKFRYENVNVVDFANKYTVTVWDGETQIGQTLSYSVNTYVFNMHADERMGEITQAVYNYGVSAKAFETAGNGHAFDHVELLKADGTLAEVIAKPDFERNDNKQGDTLDYSLKFDKARFVCHCGSTHEDNEVEATLVDKTKTFTKNDDSTEVTVNGKTYVADIQVLYAKGISVSLEEIDGKLYFVNTFEIKGYTPEEIVPFTEDDMILEKDIVDPSVEGFVTFKTNVSDYEGNFAPTEKNNKDKEGKPYGLNVKIRGEKINVASANQNGDVYSSLWDKSYETTLGESTYYSGIYWGKPALFVYTGVTAATFVQEGDAVNLKIEFKNFFQENHKYRLFFETGTDKYEEANIQKFNNGKDLTVSLSVGSFADRAVYLHFTTDGSNANRYSNLMPSKAFKDSSIIYNGRCYSVENTQYGLHMTIVSGSAISVPLTEDNAGALFRYTNAKDALEANRITVTNGDGTEKIDYLANGFVDYILFDLYKKDDENKTSCGSFKMKLNTLYAGDKTFSFIGYTDEVGYTNLYVYVNNEAAQNKFNDLLKAALGDNYEAGDYVLSAQIIMKSVTGLANGDKVFLPTDDVHTFTVS